MKNNQLSYNDYTSWKDFQSYFPEDLQICADYFPIENYFEYKGNTIHIDHYIPKVNEKKVKLILVHGGGANGRLMSPIGIALLKLGYECVIPDLPGFGLTIENSPTSYFDWVDLINYLIERESVKDNRKIVLCGISLGGMLSYHVACSNEKVYAIMVSSLADTRKIQVQKQLSKTNLMARVSLPLLNLFKGLTDSIKLPIRHTTKMWAMANDPSFVKKLKKDKIGSGGKVYLKFLRTLMQYQPCVEPENFTGCEVLFFQPEMDYIIPWEISAPFYNKLNCDKKVVFLKGCGHIPMEKPGIDQLREAAGLFLAKLEKQV